LDVSPKNWNELAKYIFKMYNEYDAFVILHNSETITYTASALSFMLENLDKTVVLGSNGILTMDLAKNYNIPEVVIYDGERIIRGCRSKNINNAINSPKYPYLGKNENKIKINSDKILSRPTEPLKLLPIDTNKKILLFKLFPGVDSKYLLSVLKEQKVDGIILESYNGFTTTDSKFLKIIGDSVKNGIYVVIVSQNMGNITNRSLEDIGVIYGRDMTCEAMLAKLYIILSNVPNLNNNMTKDLINISMRGEI